MCIATLKIILGNFWYKDLANMCLCVNIVNLIWGSLIFQNQIMCTLRTFSFPIRHKVVNYNYYNDNDSNNNNKKKYQHVIFQVDFNSEFVRPATKHSCGNLP